MNKGVLFLYKKLMCMLLVLLFCSNTILFAATIDQQPELVGYKADFSYTIISNTITINFDEQVYSGPNVAGITIDSLPAKVSFSTHSDETSVYINLPDGELVDGKDYNVFIPVGAVVNSKGNTIPKDINIVLQMGTVSDRFIPEKELIKYRKEIGKTYWINKSELESLRYLNGDFYPTAKLKRFPQIKVLSLGGKNNSDYLVSIDGKGKYLVSLYLFELLKANEDGKVYKLFSKSPYTTFKFSKATWKKVDYDYYWLGMTSTMALITMGSPKSTNNTTGSYGTYSQWVYPYTYLYFKNGVLTSWQD